MLRSLAQNWWLIVLRGVCAIGFGVIAWGWPGVTLSVLILLWGAYALLEGILAVAAAFTGAGGTPSWRLIVWGLVSIVAAGAAVLFPGLTAIALLYVIATWALVTGGLQIAAAIRLREEIEGEFWLGLAGVGSILFGLLLILRPGVGALAVIWLIGLYAIVFGVLLVALGLRVKRFRVLA